MISKIALIATFAFALTSSAAFASSITCTSTYPVVPGSILIQADEADNQATFSSDGSTAAATQFLITPQIQSFLVNQQCVGAALPDFAPGTVIFKVGQDLFNDPGLAIIVNGEQSWIIIPGLGCGQSASCATAKF